MNAPRTRRSWSVRVDRPRRRAVADAGAARAEAERQGIRYVYKIVDLPTAPSTRPPRRPAARRSELGLDGLNVNHPVKQAMVPLVDEVCYRRCRRSERSTRADRDGRRSGTTPTSPASVESFADELPDVDRDRVVLWGGRRRHASRTRWRAGGRASSWSSTRTATWRRSSRPGPGGTGRRESSSSPRPAEVLRAVATAQAGERDAGGMAAHPGTPVRAGAAAGGSLGRRHRLPAARTDC